MAKAGYGPVYELLRLPIDEQATLRALFFAELADSRRRDIHEEAEDKRIAALRKAKPAGRGPFG